MEQETTVHKRRPRYKGKYPKRFEEKYKEACDQQGKYPGGHAHLDHGERDTGLLKDSAWGDRF